MEPVKFILFVLTACALNIKQTCSFKIDTMDTFQDRIALKDPSNPYYSTGILKSHSGFSYTPNRNKTLILSAPQGYSLFADVRLLDLRPNNQDNLTLFANSTAWPVTYSNSYSVKNKFFDVYENMKTFYAPDGQLGVTFYTGPNPVTWGYDGFELIYTVQANWTKCGSTDFWCSNGRCISKSFKCDGHNHCGDRSDQKNCFYPVPVPTRTGKVVGIVGGVIFLVIAVACIIYIMIKRATRAKTGVRTVINQHPPPTNVQGYPPPYSEPGMGYPPPPPPYSQYNQGIVNPAYQ